MTYKRGELRHIKRTIVVISGLGVNITKPVICLAILGLLWGCAARNWEKSGVTEKQSRMDTSECRKYVDKNYSSEERKTSLSKNPPSRSQIQKNLYGKCMEGKGYKLEVQNKAYR